MTFNDLRRKASDLIDKVPGVLDTASDAVSSKVNSAKKSKIGKKITYLRGGDPNAEDVLKWCKSDSKPEESSGVLEEFENFLNEGESDDLSVR